MMLRMTRSWIVIAVLSVAAGAIGCGGSGESPAAPTQNTSSGNSDGGAQAGGAPAGTGKLTIGIKDSPFSDAKAVLVTFKEVSVHTAGAGWETVAFTGGAAERTCDLKQLQAATDVLGVATLPAGHYTEIRLTVERAAACTSRTRRRPVRARARSRRPPAPAPLKIPSGTVKLNRQFTVAAGGATTMLLDFDGDRSIKRTGGGNGNGNGGGGAATAAYTMTPVIAVVSVQ